MKKLSGIFEDEKREKFLAVFLTAFLLQGLAFLPFVIAQGGYYTYYGDYNVQQIPFWYHVHSAVRQGNFLWDFSTDLGSDLFGSYTFYLLGSPFFWLTVPFPDSVMPFIMPWLLSLKTAAAAVTCYALLREFVPNRNACFLGGLLYAFSGFQMYNMMFNHFHDPVAFFPLLLLGSEKLMRENKRGLFAAAVALCAVTNYFFFAGMAVFTVIWFIVNIACGRYRFTVKGFAVYAFEAVLGVLISAVILLPAAASLVGNSRTSELIPAKYSLIYGSGYAYIYILKSFFTFPDLPLEPVFDVPDVLESASVSAYLPFVSMCGVMAYIAKRIRDKKADMPVVMLAVSAVFMLVPVLNASFTMFNSQYYARWYFMPILIMCLMTAAQAGEDADSLKKWILPCLAAAVLYTAGAAAYIKLTGKGDMTAAAVTGLLPAGCLALMWSVFSDKALDSPGKRLAGIIKRTCVCCALFTALVIGQGKLTTSRFTADEYINTAFGSGDYIASLKAEGEFFRVDMCENYVNHNLIWDMGSCTSFISTVNNSVFDVLETLGFPRGVRSSVPYDYTAYRSLTSVKYYFDMPLYTEEGKAEPFPLLGNNSEGFEFKEATEYMNVYENNCFIPMGFTFDYYASPEDIAGIEARYYRSQALLEAVVLTEEQQERFSDILSPYDTANCSYDYDRLYEIAAAKRETACRDFYTDSHGFGAVFENPGDSDRLVFFSVPYDSGWSAYINGQAVPVEKVTYGFMAVRCPAGTSELRFDYTSKPLKYGGIISLSGLALLALYVILCRRLSEGKGK